MSQDETRVALDVAGVLMTIFAIIMIIAGACGATIVLNAWTVLFLSIVLFFVTIKIVYICKAPG